MHKSPPAETILALFAGPARATALYGDLVEMAAPRGRLWFLAAYARTLVSLTWRILLALAVADIAYQIIANSTGTYFRHMPAQRTSDAPLLLHHLGPPLYRIVSTLWFVLPFAAVRYSLRDRFVQLCFAVAAGTTVALLFFPLASPARDVATVALVASLALIAAAFTSRTWHKPAAVLLWTGAAGLLALTAVNSIDMAIVIRYPAWWNSHFFRHYGAMLIFRSSLLAVAFLCARMHGLLLQTSASGRTHA